MIKLTVEISEKNEQQIATLIELLGHLKSPDQSGAAGQASPKAVSESVATTNRESSESFTSPEAEFERDKVRLFRRFWKNDWRVPKNEIRSLNQAVFRNVRKAAALYSERSGYFTSEGDFYVATEKAKDEVDASIKAEKRRVAKDLRTHTKNGIYPATLSGDPRTIDPLHPRFLRNKMVRTAIARPGFFCDLTQEGVAKLDSTLSEDERLGALKWLEVTVAYHLGQFTTIEEALDFLQNVPAYLDSVAEFASMQEEGAR